MDFLVDFVTIENSDVLLNFFYIVDVTVDLVIVLGVFTLIIIDPPVKVLRAEELSI